MKQSLFHKYEELRIARLVLMCPKYCLGCWAACELQRLFELASVSVFLSSSNLRLLIEVYIKMK